MPRNMNAVLVFLLLLLAVGKCRDASDPSRTTAAARAARENARDRRALGRDAPVADHGTAWRRRSSSTCRAAWTTRVTGEDGAATRKIDVARRAAARSDRSVRELRRATPGRAGDARRLRVQPAARRTGLPAGHPDGPARSGARRRGDGAGSTADGGTPIGQAMITAKKALDATGLSRRHLLIVTDGENTDGFTPEDVAEAISRAPGCRTSLDLLRRVRRRGQPVQPAARRRRPGAAGRQRPRVERHARHAAQRQDPRRKVSDVRPRLRLRPDRNPRTPPAGISSKIKPASRPSSEASCSIVSSHSRQLPGSAHSCCAPRSSPHSSPHPGSRRPPSTTSSTRSWRRCSRGGR